MNHDPAIAAVRRQFGSHDDSHSKRTYPAAAKRSAAQLGTVQQAGIRVAEFVGGSRKTDEFDAISA